MDKPVVERNIRKMGDECDKYMDVQDQLEDGVVVFSVRYEALLEVADPEGTKKEKEEAPQHECEREFLTKVAEKRKKLGV